MAHGFNEIIIAGILDSADNSKKLVFDTSSIIAGTTVTLIIPSVSSTLITTDNVVTLTNKSLTDNSTFFIDDGDLTKRFKFELGSVTTGTTRTITVPDSDAILVVTEGNQTINGNKTFSGTINLSSLSASLPLQLDGSKNIVSSAINLTTAVTGILPIANGGTNSSTALGNGKIMVSSGGKIVEGTSSTTPSFSSESLTATSNQLTLGTTNTAGISVDSSGFTSTLVGGTAYTLIGSAGNPNVLAVENSSGKFIAMSIEAGATPNGVIHNSYAGDIRFVDSTITNINLNVHDNGNVDILGKMSSATANVSGLSASSPVLTDGSKNLVSGNIILTSQVTGILPIANGGTNSSTALVNGTLMVSAGGKIVEGPSSTTPTFTSETLTSTTNQLVLGVTNTTTINSTAPVASRTYTIPDAGTNSSFILADGTQTINGSKIFSSAVTINPTTNQIILGVTNTVTINSTAPAASRTYTIPDAGTDSNFVLTDGTQTINGSRTFSSAVTINPTTNQLVLGVTNTTTINSTAPAASRTYTIPDAGANSSFVLTNGTITINGSKTFSSAVTINPTTNQIVLGVTNTVTINSTAPAASRTYTIPDSGANSSFVLTDGNQTINGSKTFSSAVTINPTTNQIVLGVTNTVTINSTAPAASRTYTIPDSGADASFVMTEGTQTINGNKTLSGTINLSSLTASLPLQLDASKNIVSTAIVLSGSQVTNTLPIVRGGTNSATALQNGKMIISLGGSIIESTSTQASHSATVGIDGSLAVSVQQERAAAGSGNSLTLQSGGAQSGATDSAAGDVIIAGGISTGLGRGTLRLQTTSTATATGTADNTVTDRFVIAGTKVLGFSLKTITAPSPLFNFSLPASGTAGGHVRLAVRVTDVNGNIYCTTSSTQYTAVNTAGTIVALSGDFASILARTAGVAATYGGTTLTNPSGTTVQLNLTSYTLTGGTSGNIATAVCDFEISALSRVSITIL